MRASSFTAVTAALCALLCASHACALALPRPNEDCVNPPITEVTTFAFYPEDFQIKSIAPVVTSADRLSTKVAVAQDFTVRYYGSYKIITNLRKNETYVLYQCGTPNPKDLPAGTLPDVPADAKVFQIPLVSVAAADTTVNTFLSELGVVDRVAYASPYSVNACFQKLAAVCGLEAADSFNDTAMAAQADDVDAVFTSGAVDDPKTIAFSATSDEGPLNRAEWVKFAATFFNKEIEANQFFDSINASYLQTKAQAAEASAGARPVVAWVSSMSNSAGGYDGPADGMNYVVYFPVYKNTYIQDAGGAVLNRTELLTSYPPNVVGGDPWNPTTAVLINASANAAAAHAALLDVLRKADVILDETFFMDDAPSRASFLREYNISAAEAATIPALANDKVFSVTGTVSPSGGSDNFDAAVARPDVWLADLAAAIQPGAAANGAGASLLPLDGDASTAKRVVTSEQCTSVSCDERTMAAICPTTYRDCNGTLVHADPANRCAAVPVCADSATPAAAAPAKSGAAAVATGAAGAVLAALAAVLL